MYKYYEYGTVEYYDQELTKAMNNLRIVAKGFVSLVKDDTPVGKIDQYVDALHDAALRYEQALKNWNECVNSEDSNNGNA